MIKAIKNSFQPPLITTGLLFLALMGAFAGSLAQPNAVAAQTEEGQIYVVQRDDTLWKIAEKYLGDGHYFSQIVMATQARRAQDATFAQIVNPNIITAGAKLWIPAPEALPSPAAAAEDNASLSSGLASDSKQLAGQIAFAFWNDSAERCTYEINIIDVGACLESAEACQANRRIFALNNASEPALSPDGQRLAFRGWGAIPEKYKEDQLDHPYYNCNELEAERQIGTTSPDGTGYVQVTGYWEDSHPDWSPDGQRLLFDTGRLGDEITRIMAASTDGTYDETLRIAGQQPSWAPDSDRFVYRGCDLTGNRCGLQLARALPVEAWDLGLNLIGPLLEEPEAAHPDWSPVSDEIVYQSSVDGDWDLYVIDAADGNKRQLTNDPAIEGLPAWSPDGAWVAFLSDAGGDWGIWLVRADGTQRQQLFAFDGGIFTPLPITPYFQRDWLDEQISWAP